MKYNLINKITGETHLCSKITIDGFDYYVSEQKPMKNDWVYSLHSHKIGKVDKDYENGAVSMKFGESYTEAGSIKNFKKIIATNNPNIDIPKVVDDVEKLAQKECVCETNTCVHVKSYIKGYNKSQETHPFSEEDMIEFSIWRTTTNTRKFNDCKNVKEQFNVWKEQKTKTLYYE